MIILVFWIQSKRIFQTSNPA